MTTHPSVPLATAVLGSLLTVACIADEPAPWADDAGAMDDGAATDTFADSADDGGSDGDGAADAGTGGDPNADLSGEELYLAYCAACHGQDAEGTQLGYELRHPPRTFATWVVRNGRPGDEFPSSVMTPFSSDVLSDAALERIFDHLDAYPQPTDGPGLYADYCANCHGPVGAGGVVGVNISDKEGHDLLEKVRFGENTGDPGARAFYMPPFAADHLTDEELALIGAFLVPTDG